MTGIPAAEVSAESLIFMCGSLRFAIFAVLWLTLFDVLTQENFIIQSSVFMCARE